jgi:signal transduction histidine kinase
VESALEVLLVDDDDLDRAAVRRCLQVAAVPVRLVEVTDAPEALAALTNRAFDCVLLDYHLPKADGLTVLKSAREAGVSSPVIMLTGQDDASTAVAIMKAGALDYIVKAALSPERLAQSLRQAVRIGRAEKRATEAQLEADTQRARLESLFLQAPVAIAMFEGEDHRCVLANSVYGEVLSPRDLVGKPLRQAAPEFEGQGIFEIMDDVYATGETRVVMERAVRIESGDGTLAERYFNTTWQATRSGNRIGGVISIGVEVTDQVLARRERDRLYEKAQQAIRSRDDLLATVSHDLRSPVSTILMTGILLRKQPGAGEGTALARYAGAITRAAEEMERLIRDLLDIAAIEAGQLSVSIAPQPVGSLISNAIERAQTAALAKKIELCEREAATDVWVRCDGARIAQVFANLLGNAIKFTPVGGTITVGSRDDGARVTFTVSDTGDGIDPVALPHVFDRFWKAKERAEAGTGLGLAICQGIVKQHGAQIEVDSTVGVGTTFSFALPTCPAGPVEKAHNAPAVF